ncbi:uncharacterized protein LOC114311038 [Camellia sinensis]|uniref:uncharacterized protein LOC114311038 n=1 Tax=Camellia sinensis TaxID=4442 RepID=UPI001035B70D|nr:uncharacterized protein LOC114311038 [Camellia sinensis]
MLAGLLFGYIIGTIIVSISGTVAASVSFLIARYFSHDRILKLVEENKKFLAIDKTRNATGLVDPAIAVSIGALTYTLGTLVPMIRASGFATAAPVTAIKLLPVVLDNLSIVIDMFRKLDMHSFGWFKLFVQFRT